MSDMETKENIVEEHKHVSIDIPYKETRMEKSFKISIYTTGDSEEEDDSMAIIDETLTPVRIEEDMDRFYHFQPRRKENFIDHDVDG